MNYRRIRRKYSEAELAESFVFPIKLSAGQQREAASQLAVIRSIRQQAATNKDKLISCLLSLHFQLEDQHKM